MLIPKPTSLVALWEGRYEDLLKRLDELESEVKKLKK